MSRADSILKLVKDYGNSEVMDDRFALFEAIQNGLFQMEHEIRMLMPAVCCQDFANCKNSDCIPLLHHKLDAKNTEAMDERRERQYWTGEAEKLLHKLADAEANYKSAAAVTGNMMRIYAEMRDKLAEVNKL